MPEFQLDTSGRVECAAQIQPLGWIIWPDLDVFTQGYIEAAFFTEEESLTDERMAQNPRDDARLSLGFSDLAPETLARMMQDCREFQAADAWQAFKAWRDAANRWLHSDETSPADDEQAGRDFWYTRNGHGRGFWDGDWPEPYASDLTAESKKFGETWVYLGDDGKVYLS